MLPRRLRSGPPIAVDLGTANTTVYVRGRGIVLSEPSVVALDRSSGAVRAAGTNAKRMVGRVPQTIETIWPLRGGVIADFDAAEAMLRHFLRVSLGRFVRPRTVLSAPCMISEVERRAIEEAALRAGATDAYLIEEPIAAAIGAGLPIEEPRGHMIVDAGGGTTEVALISLGGVVVSRSLRIGGDDLDEAIAGHLRREHRLAVGRETAEAIKLAIGTAGEGARAPSADVRGRDTVTGLPRTIQITPEELSEPLTEPVARIVDLVRATLDRTPPDLVCDILDRGIVLTGGGGLLGGFDRRLSAETHVPVHVAESPLECVASGAGASLEEIRVYARSRSTRREAYSR